MMAEMVSVASPILLRVSTCGALPVPTACAGKLRLVGEMDPRGPCLGIKEKRNAIPYTAINLCFLIFNSSQFAQTCKHACLIDLLSQCQIFVVKSILKVSNLFKSLLQPGSGFPLFAYIHNGTDDLGDFTRLIPHRVSEWRCFTVPSGRRIRKSPGDSTHSFSEASIFALCSI